MKAIAFNRRAGYPIPVPPEVEIIVDSAIVAAGRPVFLPDFSQGWVARLYPAFKISRLGKDIAAKFADRYYDSFTIAMRLVSPELEQSLTAAGAPRGVLGLYDYCLALGPWIEVPDSEKPVEIKCGGLDCTLAPGQMLINEAVESLSRYATLKMGDVVMPCSLPAMISVTPGSDITVTLGSEELTTFRIR
jgi:hypothetical protein